MIKTARPADLKAEEPVWEGCWRNLHFNVDGTSEVCDFIHPNEMAAKSSADAWGEKVFKRGRYLDNLTNKIRPAFDYSHTIQIPWKERD